jgi:hypothetical protein
MSWRRFACSADATAPSRGANSFGALGVSDAHSNVTPAAAVTASVREASLPSIHRYTP